ncbi:hypothetical protein MASR2M8_25470 [Opitutaceae bacterium]
MTIVDQRDLKAGGAEPCGNFNKAFDRPLADGLAGARVHHDPADRSGAQRRRRWSRPAQGCGDGLPMGGAVWPVRNWQGLRQQKARSGTRESEALSGSDKTEQTMVAWIGSRGYANVGRGGL